MMAKFVPVVVYMGGDRFVVGQAEIADDGTIRGSIRNKKVAADISNSLPWELAVEPLPLNLRP
jgi:hypothetical protein